MTSCRWPTLWRQHHQCLGFRETVAIDGGFAFFHRFPDRTIDEADLTDRAPVLADFIEASASHHGFAKVPIAVGFSNGAIMAAALLLTRPGLLAGAILFRPLSPFTRDLPTRLDGVPMLIIDGENDSRRSPGDGRRLAERLIHAGATVTHHVLPTGHRLRPRIGRLHESGCWGSWIEMRCGVAWAPSLRRSSVSRRPE